jgi:response regulator RpfG family c-di-GMP phosphodiesterase
MPAPDSVKEGYSILVVEDDAQARRMVTDLLETRGYRVYGASTVGDAQTAVETHAPALIVSDRYLGKEDGLNLCRWVKDHPQRRETMVIMLTAADQTKEKLTGFEAGADDYVTKPFHPEELLSRVRVMLRMRGMQDDLRRGHEELARLNAALASQMEGIGALLVNIVGLRVPQAAVRAESAWKFVSWVGERLGLTSEELQELQLAARLHEIGKILLSDDLLVRPRSDLNPEERSTVQQFPIMGQLIVGNIPELKHLGLILRHQNENFDGTGYPGRLRGEEIPILSRILRAVTLMEDRGGSEDGSSAKVELLRQASGNVLDPRIVRLGEEYVTVVEDTTWAAGKAEISLHEVQEGMTIAMDLFTSGGIKLLPAGTRLTSSNITRIRSHHDADPIINRIYVYA